jgi:CDP-glycerol glycerophosphotransferase (TagB/SpsB family)
MIKFLFFIEREFHISLFENIINYIAQNNLGEIGLLTLPYRESQDGNPSIGCRKDFLTSFISHKFSFIANPYKYHPDITFIADSSYEKVEGLGKIINIGHGTISKGSFYTSGNLSFRENCADLLAVPGIIHKEKLEKKVTIPIEVVGISKLDNLFDNSLIKESLLQKMNLNPDNKTVLFAPTYNSELSILTYLDVDLREIIPEYFNIVVKLHGVINEKSKKYFRKYAEINPNIYYDEDYNISESMFVADVLISDVSSVIYEFLSTGKPIILFDSPLQKEFKNYNPDDLEYVYRDVGLRFSDIRKIPELLFRTFSFSSKNYSDISKKFISFNDGNSTQRVIYRSLDLLKNYVKSLIILRDSKKLKYFKDKYNSKFELVIYDSKTSFTKFLLENEAYFLKFKEIVFMDSTFKYSPLYPTLLVHHLRQNKDAKIVCSFNREINSAQNIDNSIPEVNKIPNERIGGPLTYLYSGKEVNIEYFSENSFAFESVKMFDIIDKGEFEIFEHWREFLLEYDINEKILAEDCFLWKDY